MILAVDDLKKFHHENVQMNKSHYTIANRATKAKLAIFFSDKGAKATFNEIEINDPELKD
jgi:hypothetical protein